MWPVAGTFVMYMRGYIRVWLPLEFICTLHYGPEDMDFNGDLLTRILWLYFEFSYILEVLELLPW